MFSKRRPILLSALLLVSTVSLATAHLTNPAGSATSAQFTHGDNCRWEGTKTSPCDGSSGVSGSYVALPSNRFSPGPEVSGFTLCDQEVRGAGSTPSPEDESSVDGAPGGAAPDGTWDDGGVGGACHTQAQYAWAAYNTPGCGTGATHAVAEDGVSGGDVWIGVYCDYMSDGGGCGGDGIPDAANYGPGGGSGTAVGVPYPKVLPPCMDSDGAASVLVFNYVAAGDVVPATAGWIDSRTL